MKAWSAGFLLLLFSPAVSATLPASRLGIHLIDQ